MKPLVLTLAIALSVARLGPVDVDPPAVGFFGPTRIGEYKTVRVSQQNFTGTFSETDDCKDRATIRAQSNARGLEVYRVFPGGIGTCHAHFTGGGVTAGALSITVQP